MKKRATGAVPFKTSFPTPVERVQQGSESAWSFKIEVCPCGRAE
jgi:hypothetical protein